MKRLVVGLVCVAATTGIGVGSPHASRPDVRPPALTPAEMQAAIERYQPILYFAGGEDWYPTSVSTFRSVARLEQVVCGNAKCTKGSWRSLERQPALPSDRPCAPRAVCYRLNLPCRISYDGDRCYESARERVRRAPSVVYANVVTVNDPDAVKRQLSKLNLQRPPRYLVRYSFFYYLNDWHRRRSRLMPEMWQVHEGDWESITVGLYDADSPLFAAYSQHCAGTVKLWRRVRRDPRGPTHPIAYVARGSHANYFDRRTHVTYPFECPLRSSQATKAKLKRLFQLAGWSTVRIVDKTGDATSYGPTAFVAHPLAIASLDAAWARFAGTWGEDQLFYVGGRPRNHLRAAYGTSPRTPSFTTQSLERFWQSGSS